MDDDTERARRMAAAARAAAVAVDAQAEKPKGDAPAKVAVPPLPDVSTPEGRLERYRALAGMQWAAFHAGDLATARTYAAMAADAAREAGVIKQEAPATRRVAVFRSFTSSGEVCKGCGRPMPRVQAVEGPDDEEDTEGLPPTDVDVPAVPLGATGHAVPSVNEADMLAADLAAYRERREGRGG